MGVNTCGPGLLVVASAWKEMKGIWERRPMPGMAKIAHRTALEQARRQAGVRQVGGPFCGDSVCLSERGLPPGVILLLLALADASVLLVCCFACLFFLIKDNLVRNELRDACRASISARGTADVECGYFGLPIAPALSPVVGLSRLGYGV